MKKKVFIFLALASLLVCIFAISVSAASLTNYASVELTLVDGTKATGYCVVDGYFQRDNVYINPENTDEGTYAWGNIKVFDMRDSVIVGTKTYTSVKGTNCNPQATNVEEYYFSSQVTTILNTSFTSGWKSLKTVYIPSTVAVIDGTSFTGSYVENVVFQEGSKLKSIGDNAFKDCTNLTTFDFPEGLESLGRNCFWNAGLSGTIVIPNSVTYLAPGSLLSTKIENLYLGDGELEIGYNFLGTYQRTDNAYLKNVYIPATAKLTVNGGSKIFIKCANPVNFYIVGTDEECDAMVTTLKSHSTGNYMTFVTESEAQGLGINWGNGAGYGIIHTGYNRCDVFYNGEHLTPEQAYEFTSFTEKSYVKSTCTRCKNTMVLQEIEPLFINLGYSAAEYGDIMSVNYKVNAQAVKDYEEIKGVKLNYGVFAVLAKNIGDKELFGADGKAEAGVIAADITDSGYTLFNLKIVGFCEEQKGIALAMGAYVATSKSDTTEYTYLQIAQPTEGKKYYFASYNDIVGKPSTYEEVVQ